MICPRCDSENCEVMATSPVGKVWEMYICPVCTYSWRSTETADKTDPKLYSKKFKIKPEEISKMLVIPAIAPLKV